MIQKNISVTKTARYYTLGEFNKDTEQVWFVCHGYGQLAQYFIKKFEVLNNGKNVIVAPEALNRFYWQGFTGRVAASWMTKEGREDEILDYTNYLDKVYEEVLVNRTAKKIKINVLGFSQSTATVCRWLALKRPEVDNLILWAGLFPHDLEFEKDKQYFNSLNVQIIYGAEDEFINTSTIEKHSKELSVYGYNADFQVFKGKHEIPEQELLKLAASL